MSKTETLSRLGAILAEMYDAQHQGADIIRLCRAKGLADGYMRALCDLGITNDMELLSFINEQKHIAASKADRMVSRTSTMRQAVDFA